MQGHIEEMKQDLFGSVAWKELDDGAVALDIDATTENLAAKGYRKQSEVAEELFKDFEDILFRLAYLGEDGKYHIRKTSANEATKLVDEYCELVKKYIKE